MSELVRPDSTNLVQVGGDSEVAARNLTSSFRRVSANATREVDNLISELQTLRDHLRADSSRIERGIAEYAALSQSVIQLTNIISDGVTHVKKGPDAASITQGPF
jgi:hypothetical protein